MNSWISTSTYPYSYTGSKVKFKSQASEAGAGSINTGLRRNSDHGGDFARINYVCKVPRKAQVGSITMAGNVDMLVPLTGLGGQCYRLFCIALDLHVSWTYSNSNMVYSSPADHWHALLRLWWTAKTYYLDLFCFKLGEMDKWLLLTDSSDQRTTDQYRSVERWRVSTQTMEFKCLVPTWV